MSTFREFWHRTGLVMWKESLQLSRDRALLARCAALKDYTTICASAPSEVLGLVALRARETVLARSRAIVGPNLALFDAFLADRPGFASWVRPAAGSVGFPRLAPGLDADRFAADLVEATGVLLLPGSAFGHAGNHVRVGLGREDFPVALDRLAEYLQRRRIA